MNFIKRYWVIVAVLITLSMSFVVRNPTKSKTAKQPHYYTVKRQDLVQTMTLSGKVDALQKATLRFQTSGRLAWVGVAEGDSVRAYQTIATLDSREVQKTLEKTLRDYSKQRNDFEQMWRVTYDGKKPEDALNDTVKRILEKNQWDLERAVLDVELKHLAVEYATLATPIAGVVTHIDTPVAGVNITPAGAEFDVLNPSSVYLAVLADQSEAAKLSTGMTATLTFDAFPNQTYAGTVSAIGFVPKAGESGTVYEVRVLFPNQNSDNRFRLDMTADALFTIAKKEQVLAVPSSSVTTKNGISYVNKRTGDKTTLTPVTLGDEFDSMREVLDGISEGDIIND